jgi:hypothetical protein
MILASIVTMPHLSAETFHASVLTRSIPRPPYAEQRTEDRLVTYTNFAEQMFVS